MRRIKSIINVTVLCICVLFSGLAMPVVIHAEEPADVAPYMTYISTYSTDVSISSSGVASIYGLVRAKDNVTTYVKVTLQIYKDGAWRDVKSWEDSGNMGSTVAADYQLFSRGSYRTYMVCSANTETKSATSATRVY
ncbi:MAG: hypothetical protein E7284_07470 [Lachnospiraceae bacterium]|nr:hypothetical protein [Lachnospiraceae bacterium]